MIDLDADQLARRLDEIVTELGEAPRAEECARVLRAVAGEVGAGRPIVGAAPVQQFALAMQDASMVVGAFDALIASHELPTARDRFREALKGATIEVPADGDDDPRNKLWELFVAACLRNNGLVPEFGNLVCAPRKLNPDLFTSVGRVRLAVEAKRIRGGRRQLPGHVAKAVAQIHTACEAKHSAAGFIAIDLSFSLGEHAQTREPRMILNRNELDLVKQEITPRFHKRLTEVAPMIEQQPGAKSIIGVTMMLLPVVHYAETRGLGLVRYFGTCALEVEREPSTVEAYKILYGRCFSGRS